MTMKSTYVLQQANFNLDPSWSLISYVPYLDYIQKNSDAETSKENDLIALIKYVSINKTSDEFKWNIEIGTMQFLVGVFPAEKCIRIASKQLNYELNLIHFEENNQSKEIIEMKSHIHSIAEIPLESSPSIIEFISTKNDLPLFNESSFTDNRQQVIDFDEVHLESSKLSQELIFEISKYKQSLFEKVSDFGLDLTANFMLIRIHLLKFLAILPNLAHDLNGLEVKRIFNETIRRLIEDSQLADFKNLKGQKKPLPALYILCM